MSSLNSGGDAYTQEVATAALNITGSVNLFSHEFPALCGHMNDLELSLGLHKRQKDLSSFGWRRTKARGEAN